MYFFPSILQVVKGEIIGTIYEYYRYSNNMHNELDFTIVLMILLVTFSPIIIGLTVLFYIKSRQTKEIHKTQRGTFQEIFGLK